MIPSIQTYQIVHRAADRILDDITRGKINETDGVVHENITKFPGIDTTITYVHEKDGCVIIESEYHDGYGSTIEYETFITPELFERYLSNAE